MPDVPAIETRGLLRRYGALVAVDRLDLAVRSGELIAFLGPNGAGKTTTIRMLTGLIRPSEGSAWIDGVDVARDPLRAKSRVGVVPQRSNLYAELSARANLMFVAALYGLHRRERAARVNELLSEFGLSDRSDSPFSALSGGMKRRLTIAAALVHRPAILFLDEPTTGLDVQSARALRGLIRTLHESGVTVFLTTHMIDEAERLADRVAIIVKGRLVALGTPAELRATQAGTSRLDVTYTSVPKGLEAALLGMAPVESVSVSGGSLSLVARSTEEALEAALRAGRDFGVSIREIRTSEPNLEDAFVHLTHLDAEAMRNGLARASEGGRP